MAMTVDDKLGFDKFNTDEEHSHIKVNKNCRQEDEIKKLILACPAGLYRYEKEEIVFSHEGCLECGTCRVLSGGKIVQEWNYPADGAGVEYRQG